MSKANKKIVGVTLIEIMLVLVIGAMILLFGFQQYASFRRDAEIRQLQNNVNTLFQGLARYYRANCMQDPFNTARPGLIVAVSYNTLVKEGFLPEKLSPNAYVQGSGADPNTAYILQFNQLQVPTTGLPQRLQKLANSTNANMGSIIIWQAQVAVNLSNIAPPSAIRGAASADCLSTGTTDNDGVPAVVACSGAGADTNPFAVWERLPSFPNNDVQNSSPLWQTMSTVKEFTQMYTTYPFSVLANPNSTITPNQYYICGS